MLLTKQQYNDFCRQHHDLPIFLQDWWLESVCTDGEWGVTMETLDDSTVGILPFYQKKRFGMTHLSMPPLTQHLGVWISSPTIVSAQKKLSHEKKLMTALIEQLPSYTVFTQNFSPAITNWLPFYWKGFTQTTKYTYIIDQLKTRSEKELFSLFKENMRNKIHKAQKMVTHSNESIDTVYTLLQKTFKRQEKSIPFSKSIVTLIDSALEKRNQRKIFCAKDANGNIHSVLYLIWDTNAAYVHMVGEDPQWRASGAGILLLWEALLYTKNTLKLNVFNFEGSMIERVEQVRRSCGGIQLPYFQISKCNSRMLNIKRALFGA